MCVYVYMCVCIGICSYTFKMPGLLMMLSATILWFSSCTFQTSSCSSSVLSYILTCLVCVCVCVSLPNFSIRGNESRKVGKYEEGSKANGI